MTDRERTDRLLGILRTSERRREMGTKWRHQMEAATPAPREESKEQPTSGPIVPQDRYFVNGAPLEAWTMILLVLAIILLGFVSTRGA